MEIKNIHVTERPASTARGDDLPNRIWPFGFLVGRHYALLRARLPTADGGSSSSPAIPSAQRCSSMRSSVSVMRRRVDIAEAISSKLRLPSTGLPFTTSSKRLRESA